MRVAVVTTSYPVRPGDPAGHFVEAEVVELRREGHEVTVLRPEPGGAFGWPGAAARIREKPLRALDAGAWMVRAAVALRLAHPQRVIAHWSIPSAQVALASGVIGPGTPLEIVSHGGDVRLLCAMPDRVRDFTVTALARRASRWRFVSEALLEELALTIPHALAEEVRAIAEISPSPLGMPDQTAIASKARARRDALGDRRLYVCAGRLVASKRVDKVIDYVAGARASHPVLVVLGDGPERAHLERVAERWCLDVRFLGKTPREEALTWIGAADEVVHASQAEGLSTVVREAEHLGVKVTLL